MKNILIVLGGGRKNGNTFQLADSFRKGAEEAGNTVKTVSLMDKRVEGCRGCNACRYQKPCVIQDDFASIIPDIMWADCIVFCSPLYFWNISSRLKAFIERFYCIAQPDDNPPKGRYEKYFPNKDSVLLMTAADNLFWTFSQAEAYYKFAVVNYIGFNDRGMILAGGTGGSSGAPMIDKTKYNTHYLRDAYEMGLNIYKD